jgi:glucokinase
MCAARRHGGDEPRRGAVVTNPQNDRMSVLAVDIGGTKLAAGVVDPDGTLRRERRVPTPPGGTAEQLWQALAGLVDDVLAEGEPITGVGVGSAGPMRWPVGEVSPLNIPGWRDFPVRARLARHLGLPVRLHNDAVCTAIGEHWRGAGQGHDHMIGMVVSTGVGGGLILDGELVDGASGNAGHIGHIVVEPDGPLCGCGGYGCLEAVARGPALVEWAVARGWTGTPTQGGTGRELTAKALAESALAGDPTAQAAFDRCGSLVGLGIASAANLVDVDLVVIGGGVAQSGDLLFTPLRAAFARYGRVLHSRNTRIVPAVLGGNAGLMGAAALVLAGNRYWSAPS